MKPGSLRSRSRLFFPAVTVLVGAAMLAIPWILPVGREHGRAIIFVLAGLIELALGTALAYLVLHEHPDDDLPGPSGPRSWSRD